MEKKWKSGKVVKYCFQILASVLLQSSLGTGWRNGGLDVKDCNWQVQWERHDASRSTVPLPFLTGGWPAPQGQPCHAMRVNPVLASRTGQPIKTEQLKSSPATHAGHSALAQVNQGPLDGRGRTGRPTTPPQLRFWVGHENGHREDSLNFLAVPCTHTSLATVLRGHFTFLTKPQCHLVIIRHLPSPLTLALSLGNHFMPFCF